MSWNKTFKQYRMSTGLNQGNFLAKCSELFRDLGSEEFELLQEIEVEDIGALGNAVISRYESGSIPKKRPRHLSLIWVLKQLKVLKDIDEVNKWLSQAAQGTLNDKEVKILGFEEEDDDDDDDGDDGDDDESNYGRLLSRITGGCILTVLAAIAYVLLQQGPIQEHNLELLNELIWGAFLGLSTAGGVWAGEYFWPGKTPSSAIENIAHRLFLLAAFSGGLIGGFLWYGLTVIGIMLGDINSWFAIMSPWRIVESSLWAACYIGVILYFVHWFGGITLVWNAKWFSWTIAGLVMIVALVGVLILLLSVRFGGSYELINNYALSLVLRVVLVLYFSVNLIPDLQLEVTNLILRRGTNHPSTDHP